MLFSSSSWNQGQPLFCYDYLEQIPQPDVFPQTGDAFTSRAVTQIVFNGSGKRERQRDISLKYQFKSKVRAELSARIICLIPRWETMKEGQGKSNCFAFVAGEAFAPGLPQLSWYGATSQALHISVSTQCLHFVDISSESILQSPGLLERGWLHADPVEDKGDFCVTLFRLWKYLLSFHWRSSVGRWETGWSLQQHFQVKF